MRKIIIDTDTASDDAIAIVMALRHPDVEVVALTTVAGNVPLSGCVRNALISTEKAGTYKPPVYIGCDRPIVVPYRSAQHVHGADGLGDVGYPDPVQKPETEHAVDAIIRLIDEHDDIEVVTLGPLTNIAMAIKMAPKIMKKLKKLTAMGGQYRENNPHEPTAEFNILVDPDALDIVLKAGVHVTFAPLDICYGDTEYLEDEIEELYNIGTEVSKFFVDANRALVDYIYNKHGIKKLIMPDPTAMAVYLEPSIVTEYIDSYAQVETKSPLCMGQVIYDYRNIYGKTANSRLITKINGVRFKELVSECAK